ncbi:MAG TPA: UDP-N-acetylmuramoyl-tripeptide--D-alanyl-D-alanine ligase [Bacilli bacterium]
MIKKKLAEIAIMVDAVYNPIGGDSLEISGVTTDSRSVAEGNLFVPIIGDRFDGHDFVTQAYSQGAAASLWQKDKPNPPEDIPLLFVDDSLAALQQLAQAYRTELPARIIGVTGSNGKTTTKDMIAAILATTYKVHKTQGNLNNHIGLPLTILQMDEETEMAVLEMGMSGRGEIALLSRIAKPEAAVITNIGESHLLQLGSREQIALAKLEILQGMAEDGLLVYNGDEPLLERLIGKWRETHPALKTFRFGAQCTNDYYPVGIMLNQEENRTYFSIHAEGTPTFSLPLLGEHNVINALSAIAISKYMGVSDDAVKNGLKQLHTTGMRIEVVKGVTGLTILNDAYNASPTSMKAALKLVAALKGYRQKIVVLGDMLELGEREIEFHREIGRMLEPGRIDRVFVFGKLARYIAEEAEKKFAPGKVVVLPRKEDIAGCVAEFATREDVVLFKASRGMKLEEAVERLKQLKI